MRPIEFSSNVLHSLQLDGGAHLPTLAINLTQEQNFSNTMAAVTLTLAGLIVLSRLAYAKHQKRSGDRLNR